MVKSLELVNTLPLLNAPIIGGVIQVDGHARQVHDMAHWSCISLQAI